MATIHDFARMCRESKNCSECPLTGACMGSDIAASADIINKEIDNWVIKNPITTYLSNFSETLSKR